VSNNKRKFLAQRKSSRTRTLTFIATRAQLPFNQRICKVFLYKVCKLQTVVFKSLTANTATPPKIRLLKKNMSVLLGKLLQEFVKTLFFKTISKKKGIVRSDFCVPKIFLILGALAGDDCVN